MKFTRQAIVFIAVVTVLSAALFAGGIWAINAQKKRDAREIGEIKNDLNRLINQAQTEINYTQDAGLYYPGADSVRAELGRLVSQADNDKRQIDEQPNANSSRRAEFEANLDKYRAALDQVSSTRNQYTSNFMATAQAQIQKLKDQLDELLQKNKSLSAQLARAIRNFKGAQGELSKLKAKQAEADRAIQQLASLRSELDSTKRDRDELKELLARSEELLKKQAEDIKKTTDEVAVIKEEAKLAKNFKAQYTFRKRQVDLNGSDKNLARQVDDMNISFDLSKNFFDQNTPNGERIVYLTLLKGNQPYRYNKQPVKITNNKGTLKLEIKPKLDKGDYTFRLTYQEKPILSPEYKFNID